MGKDFTPYMHHKADQQYNFSSKPLILENIQTGEKTIFHDPSCTDALRWPNSYYLASSILEDHKSSPEKMDMFEKILTKIIELSDAGKYVNKCMKTPFEHTICKWYFGKLDPDFYYNTINNEKMSEAIATLK